MSDEVLDSELVKFKDIMERMDRKYSDRPHNFSNSLSFRNEVTEEFRLIGWNVAINDSRYPPEVELTDRINIAAGFDHEKKKWEVEKGMGEAFYKD